MRKPRLLVACLPLLGAALGCSDDAPPITPGADAQRFDSGPDGPPVPDGSPFDARQNSDAPVDPEGPTVTLLDPDADQLVTSEQITVRCRAEENAMTGHPVTSVTFDLDDAEGTRVTVVGASSAPDEWSGVANLVGLANGPLAVTCVATATLDDESHSSSDQKIARLDHGPRVTILSPTEGQAVHGQISVSFEVTAWPITEPDPMAAVNQASIAAFIRGIEITDELTATPIADGFRYSGTVQADDPGLFTPSLEGPSTLRIDAANLRAVTRVERVVFEVDNDAPDVIIESPLAGDLVGGIIHVTATVTDENGVDPDNVRAVLGHGPDDLAVFNLTHTMGDVYEGSYDSRDLVQVVEALYGECGTDCTASSLCPPGQACVQVVFPTLSVRARDLAGNEGSTGQVVTLDYTPPVAELDPPLLREGAFSSLSGQIECSYLFDPVGDDAVNDRQAVAQLSELRARIEDLSNGGTAPSGVIVPAAGVDDGEVQILVLSQAAIAAGTPNVGDALVVDTDGDGVCDDVNPFIVPSTIPAMVSTALAVNLVPVPTGGESLVAATGYLGPGAGFGDVADFGPDYPMCNRKIAPPDPAVKDALCAATSGLQRVIKSEIGPGSVIYAIPPLTTTACVGFPFDSVANNVADGWACIAVRVEDNLGNVGVSRPLRVCFDHDGDGAEGCPAFPSNYPLLDTTYDPTDWPTVPLGTPPASLDCTGTYQCVDADTNGECDLPLTYQTVTGAAGACTMPLGFGDLPVKLRRTDF